MESDGTVTLQDYSSVMSEEEMAELRALARPLAGARVQHINSTRVGGGVAEILARLVPLLKELGLNARWDVIDGDADFFRVTKMFHNALHGDPADFVERDFEIVRENARRNLHIITNDDDFVAIHDPQPIGLMDARDDRARGKWVWRCHIDISEGDPRVLRFLRPHIERFDAAIFHLADYAKDLAIPQFIMPPAIDPLSEKNRELAPEEVRLVLERFGIDPSRPIVLQVSRFDRLKDPVGVVQAFKIARAWNDCQLVLAGGSASDDPEGEQVFAETREAANGVPDVHLLALPPDAHREINALQRGATVVVQKSLKEGFGLVVAEAMWKGKPVIGGNVGGIRRQIFQGDSGFLVHSPEGCAFRIRQLLCNPGLARRLGENARQYVKDNFLLPTYLRMWVLVLNALRRGRDPIIDLGT